MKITATFKGSDGNELTATFDQETKTVVDSNGRKGTYTRDEALKAMTIDVGGEKLSLTTKETMQLTPGFSTGFTSSNGKSGTVTIVSVV